VPFEKGRRLIGMGGDKVLREVSPESEKRPTGRRINRRCQEIFMERYVPSLRPCPGAQDLLEHLRASGLRLVVASSATDVELDALLVCGGDKLIDARISADDADNSKPDPDIVKAALDKTALGPHEAVMLGDTPCDVAAASKAGVAVIAFRCGGWTDADLKGALAVYDDPADLLAHYDTSPLAWAKCGLRAEAQK
jgi:HAD superfamily hydrolase (TIGR01509 family)